MNNPRGYSREAIEAALKMKSGSRKVSFRYDLLNRHDIPIGALDGVTHANISYGEFRHIRRSMTMGVKGHLRKEINFLSDQVQPWFVLHMSDRLGDVAEWPLGIFMPGSPGKDFDGMSTTRDIGLCDKTLIIAKDGFRRRAFFPAGTNYVAAVTRMLNTAGITKINIAPSHHVLPNSREFPIGTTILAACNELLQEINFNTLWVDGYGVTRSEPYVRPSHREVTHVYDATQEDSVVILPARIRLDIANRPNVFIRVALNLEGETELVSEFVNDDPRSSISTVSRGRNIVDYDEMQDIASQEALDDFVQRLAVESASAYEHLEFNTVLMPTHGSAETLLCTMPGTFEGTLKFHETGWEMPLTHDGVMKHSARRVVQI